MQSDLEPGPQPQPPRPPCVEHRIGTQEPRPPRAYEYDAGGRDPRRPVACRRAVGCGRRVSGVCPPAVTTMVSSRRASGIALSAASLPGLNPGLYRHFRSSSAVFRPARTAGSGPRHAGPLAAAAASTSRSWAATSCAAKPPSSCRPPARPYGTATRRGRPPRDNYRGKSSTRTVSDGASTDSGTRR